MTEQQMDALIKVRKALRELSAEEVDDPEEIVADLVDIAPDAIAGLDEAIRSIRVK